MTERLKHTIVEFRRPFQIEGLDGPQPAGRYEIETTEAELQGLFSSAYQRISTTITACAGRMRQLSTINPADLEGALKKDAES